MTVKGTSGTLSGLVENTPYAITVQAMTGNSRKSALSSEVSVMTHAAGKSYNYIIKIRKLNTITPQFLVHHHRILP